MPEKSLANFDVKYIQVMDENGNVDQKIMPEISDDTIKKMYEFMILAKIFDERALDLQREGRIGTYASTRGQEAASLGIAFAMNKEDWIFPSFREHPALIYRNLPMDMQYLVWAGDERGHKIPENVNIFTMTIPVSTHIPHAVGFAWGAKLRKKNFVTVCFFGDGATSKGDFGEGLNFAGTFKTPVVFVCQNNQWAISVPRSRQTAAQTLAQKAVAFGFEGIQVDGNDIFAVYKAGKYALDKARAGKGPTLIECYTYRLSDHTTADDAKKYRSDKEVEEWKKKDPIDRLRKFMQKKGLWNENYEKKVLEDARKKVDSAVQKMESMPPADPKDIFKYQYAEMPWHLQEQMKELSE